MPKSSSAISKVTPPPEVRLLWIIAVTVLGVILAVLSVYEYVQFCQKLPTSDSLQMICAPVAVSPPWSLLTSLVAGPAILLTWYWRTVSRDLEISQKEQELQKREREILQKEGEDSLDIEVRRQVATLKVAAILELYQTAEPFFRDSFNVRPGSQEDVHKALDGLQKCLF